MHRDDDLRLDLFYHGNRFFAIYSVCPADRDHQNINFADRFNLLISQFILPEIAQMANFYIFNFQYKNSVEPALGALFVVVVRRDADDLHAGLLVLPRSADDKPFRVFSIVVIMVLVGDENYRIAGTGNFQPDLFIKRIN